MVDPYGISESDASSRIKSIRMRRVLINEFNQRLADIKSRSGTVPQEAFHIVVKDVMKDAQVDGVSVPMPKVVQMLLPSVGEVLDCGYNKQDLENWLDGKKSNLEYTKKDGEFVFLGIKQQLTWRFKRRADHDSTHSAYDICWRTLHTGGGDIAAAAAAADQLQDANGKAATAAAIQSATQTWEKTLWCSVAERVRDDRRHMQYYPMSQEHVFDCLAQIMQAKEAYQLRTLVVSSPDQVRGTRSLRVDMDAYRDSVPQRNGLPDFDTLKTSYPPISMAVDENERHVIPFEAAQWRRQPQATNIAPSRSREDAEALLTGSGLSQQRLDWLLSTDSLPSCLALTSGEVVKGRPIEQSRGQIMVNSGFLIRHVALHAEMAATLAVVPGLRMVAAPQQSSCENEAQMKAREEQIRNGGGGAHGQGGQGMLSEHQRGHLQRYLDQVGQANVCGATALSAPPMHAASSGSASGSAVPAAAAAAASEMDVDAGPDQGEGAAAAAHQRLSRTVESNRKHPHCDVASDTSENPTKDSKRLKTGLASCADHLVLEELRAEMAKRPMSSDEKARWFLKHSKFGKLGCNLFDCASIFFSLKAAEQLDVSNKLVLDTITKKFPDVFASTADAAESIPEFTSRFAPANGDGMLSFADGLVTFRGANRISKSNEAALREKRKARESGPEALAIVKRLHYAKTRENVTDIQELRKLAPLYMSKETVGRGNPLKRSELFKSLLQDKLSAGLIRKNSPMVLELHDGAMIMARVRTRLAKDDALCGNAKIKSVARAAEYLRPIKADDGVAAGTAASLEEDLWGVYLEAECGTNDADEDAEMEEEDADAGMLDDVCDFA